MLFCITFCQTLGLARLGLEQPITAAVLRTELARQQQQQQQQLAYVAVYPSILVVFHPDQ
jgi:hypothetical protein